VILILTGLDFFLPLPRMTKRGNRSYSKSQKHEVKNLEKPPRGFRDQPENLRRRRRGGLVSAHIYADRKRFNKHLPERRRCANLFFQSCAIWLVQSSKKDDGSEQDDWRFRRIRDVEDGW